VNSATITMQSHRAPSCRDVDEDERPSREDLVFKKGDIIKVLDDNPTGWWFGELNGQKGQFPANFCERVDSTTATASKK